MNRRGTLNVLAASVSLAYFFSSPAHAQDTIKVGVLHSLSGTMAISETVLKDTVLMAIDDDYQRGVTVSVGKVEGGTATNTVPGVVYTQAFIAAGGICLAFPTTVHLWWP